MTLNRAIYGPLAAGLIFGLTFLTRAVLPDRVADVAFMLAVLAIIAMTFLIDHSSRERQRRRRSGLCECGYDLRATPLAHESGGSTRQVQVCPECGYEHVTWSDT